MAGTIPGDPQRGEALAGIAGRLAAAADPRDPALIDQAIAVAETTPVRSAARWPGWLGGWASSTRPGPPH